MQMNAYPAQRSDRANIFSDRFLKDFQENTHKYLCSVVIQVSVSCDFSNEYRVDEVVKITCIEIHGCLQVNNTRLPTSQPCKKGVWSTRPKSNSAQN